MLVVDGCVAALLHPSYKKPQIYVGWAKERSDAPININKYSAFSHDDPAESGIIGMVSDRLESASLQ